MILKVLLEVKYSVLYVFPGLIRLPRFRWLVDTQQVFTVSFGLLCYSGVEPQRLLGFFYNRRKLLVPSLN